MEFIAALTIFVLAMFVGFEIILRVPSTLHTPLMSGANAISGITLVGAIIAAGSAHHDLSRLLGFLAVFFATTNVIGGFLVTRRMLRMFSGPGGGTKKPASSAADRGEASSAEGSAHPCCRLP